MSELISNLNTIESCKLDIKSAIEAKGVDMTSASLPDYAACIGSIAAGITEKDITERQFSIANLNNDASYVGYYAFAYDSWIETVNLPYCNQVYDYAFQSCNELYTVNLPICTRIFYGVFSDCYSLSSVNIPQCGTIDEGAFINCGVLESLSFPECTFIGNSTFVNCDNLSNIYVPKCITIGEGAFMNCGILNIDLPSCKTIGSDAFGGCPSLSCVSIPFIHSLGMSAFENCGSLFEITLGTSTYHIPSYNDALVGTTYTDGGDGVIYIDQTMYSYYATHVEWGSFVSYFVSVGTSEQMLSIENGNVFGKTYYLNSDCLTFLGISKANITSISFSNISSIGAIFSGCTNLTSVSLPNVTILTANNFRNCSKLPAIRLPKCENITGNYVFSGCTSLKSIYLPGSSVCKLAYSNAIPNNALLKIYVPSSLLTTYKNTKNWSYFAAKIYTI